MTKLAHSAERHELEHGGARVVWRQIGQGPALLLLHGGHGDWRHWIRNIDVLARQHTLLLPDLPGYGESDELPQSSHPADPMDRLLGVLEHGLDVFAGSGASVAVGGFSIGGLVAAQLAARGRVRRLALLGAAGHGGPRPSSAPLQDWRALRGDPAAQRSALRQNLAALMFADADQADEPTVALYAAQCAATRFRSKALSKPGRLQGALAAYAGPLLLLWGEQDITGVPRELLPQLAAGRNECRHEIVSGAGHWVQYERPAAVSQLLVDWFGSKDPQVPNSADVPPAV